LARVQSFSNVPIEVIEEKFGVEHPKPFMVSPGGKLGAVVRDIAFEFS
jgi:hypothetical protein